MFPEPGIFVGANEVCRTRYFATWLAIEPACIYRLLSSSTSTPLSNQEWRDVLIGNIPSKSSTSHAALAREQARRLLGSAVDDLGITINETSTDMPPPLEDSEAKQILWRLSELNFRSELLALDKRAGPKNRDENERQQIVCESLQIRSLLVVDLEEAKQGFYSNDWRRRLPCLLQLQRLMSGWAGITPPVFANFNSRSSQDFQEADVLLLEDTIARYYTDLFFRLFGRAAIIPVRLP